MEKRRCSKFPHKVAFHKMTKSSTPGDNEGIHKLQMHLVKLQGGNVTDDVEAKEPFRS